MHLPVEKGGVGGGCENMQEAVLQVDTSTLHHASSGREPLNGLGGSLHHSRMASLPEVRPRVQCTTLN